MQFCFSFLCSLWHRAKCGIIFVDHHLSIVIMLEILHTSMALRKDSLSWRLISWWGSVSPNKFVLLFSNTFSILFLELGAVTVLGMILTTEAASGKGDIRKRRIMAIVGLALLAFFFSLILSIFRSKAGGYPYRYIIL